MKTQKLRYTVREAYNPYTEEWEKTLIFLDEPSTRGNLLCWQPFGEHGECAFAWYSDRTRSRGGVSRKDAEEFLAYYLSLYPETGVGDAVSDYRYVSRIPFECWVKSA